MKKSLNTTILIKLGQLVASLVLVLLVSGAAGYFIVRAGCEDGGGGPAESFLLVTSVFACGDSGYTGGGDSAGSGGGSYSNDGNSTDVGGSNFTDGGSGGGSNQNNSGDEGNNTSPAEDTGYNCGTECAAPVLSATTRCEGTQPVIDLSWSGVPTPTSANGWLGSTSFLMRSPRIYTGVLVPNNIMRTFGVAYFHYGTLSFTDTYREYWIPAYTIPAWTEITGTDENGNPTGAVDHPATNVPAQLALTDTVNPSTTYLYQIYASNASAALVYSSGVNPPGFTPNLSYTARTLLSNLVSITTLPCDGTTPASPSPSAAPSTPPSPSPSSLPSPVVNLNLTTPRGSYGTGDIPATVQQNERVTINWYIQNATSATASSNPAHPSWNGEVDPNSGSLQISTSTTGTFVFTLTATNATGSTPVSVQLNINPATPPYIQTTGGDVHSNEDIYITP